MNGGYLMNKPEYIKRKVPDNEWNRAGAACVNYLNGLIDDGSHIIKDGRLVAVDTVEEWRPEVGEEFFIPMITNERLYASTFLKSIEDDLFIDRNLAFRTKEEAVAMSKKILEFIKNRKEILEFIKTSDKEVV